MFCLLCCIGPRCDATIRCSFDSAQLELLSFGTYVQVNRVCCDVDGPQVSDNGVSAVAKTGRLHKLVARACPNITDKGEVMDILGGV